MGEESKRTNQATVASKAAGASGTTTSPRLVAVLPAYNEERFIGSIVIKTKELVDQVIVIDDGSTDMTAIIAQAAGALLVKHPKNMGKGVALNSGFLKARQLGASIVVTIDADGQHLPEQICSVIAPIEAGEADIVIGSRYLELHSEVPRHRIWGHKAFTFLTNQASGASVTDSQSGYRAFSARALEMVSFLSNGFSVESEIQFIASENALRLVEVPITIRYESKPKRPVTRQGLEVLNGLLYMVSQYRPLLFFGVTGMALMLIGLGWGLKVVDAFYTTRKLAIGSALLSALFVILGTGSLSTGIILHSMRAMFKNLISMIRNPDSKP